MAKPTSNVYANSFALDYDVIVVVNFGSQRGPTLARSIRSGGVYSEIWPASVSMSEFNARKVKGIVVAVGRTQAMEVPSYLEQVRNLNIPVLRLDEDEGRDLSEVLRDFALNTCACEPTWTMSRFVESAVRHIRRQVGDDAVVCGLSGGVDSSVAAALVYRAIGDQLTTIFVDHGLLRKGEAEQVTQTFHDRFGPGFVKVDAAARFLEALAGVSDPEAKRKIIGNEFIHVFEETARQVGQVRHLVQGTLYTDVIESGGGGTAVIKSHHNVGGLPDDMDLQLLEPLNSLFKDEVRALGDELGLPRDIVWRQPFPGPGLAIRVMGAVDADRLAIEREADAILVEEIARSGLEDRVWQYFTVLLNTRTVGMLDSQRTYGYVVAIRAVTSQDGTAAGWAHLPYDVLERIADRMMHEVPGVSRVVYDISSKPPATIEWE